MFARKTIGYFYILLASLVIVSFQNCTGSFKVVPVPFDSKTLNSGFGIGVDLGFSTVGPNPTNAPEIPVQIDVSKVEELVLTEDMLSIENGSFSNFQRINKSYWLILKPTDPKIAATLTISIAGEDLHHEAFGAFYNVDYLPAQTVLLGNGIRITNQCNLKGDQQIAFTNERSHRFLGYGVNVEAGNKAHTPAEAVKDITDLGLKFVKMDLGNPFKGSEAIPVPPPGGGTSDQAMYNLVYSAMADYMNDPHSQSRDYYNALKAAGIRVIATMYGQPNAYVSKTEPGNIDENAIPDFAQFYVAYMRATNTLGLTPDYQEMQNEPNLGDPEANDAQFTAQQFAEFMSLIQSGMKRNSVAFPITATGTCNSVSVGLDFVKELANLNAIKPHDGLPGLTALTFHNYYIADYPNNNGVPPADDIAFSNISDPRQPWGIVQFAQDAKIPVIHTEFGGTNQKYKDIDPNINATNPSEELKAALDLIRMGDSAAIVWNLYPNNKSGVLLKTWALVDDESGGPTKGYWVFKALAKIPAGDDAHPTYSLKTDLTQTQVPIHSSSNPDFPSGNPMLKLGYAAYEYQEAGVTKWAFGLSNPYGSDGFDTDKAQTTVTLKLENFRQLSFTTATSFSEKSLLSPQGAQLPLEQFQDCDISVTLPPASGLVLNATAK
jgi:hypothetical protein